MTSLLCVKQPGGRVHVHDESLTKDLNEDISQPIKSLVTYRDYSHKKSPKTRPATIQSTCYSRSRHQSRNDKQGAKMQDWLSDKTVKTLQERADAESQSARELYHPLLDTEETFVKDVDDYLKHKSTLEQRKKEILHKSWTENVHEPVRQKIITAMDSSCWPDLDRRKRQMHKQYLEFVNGKGHVFLDTLDPEEYYAQALNGNRPAPIAIKTANLRDPLLSQQRARCNEDRTLMRCTTGSTYSDNDIENIKLPPLPLVPLGRHGTDSLKWLEMPLNNIDSTPRKFSMARRLGKYMATSIDFSAWSRMKHDPAIVEEEMQIPRKKVNTDASLTPIMARMKGRCTTSSIDFEQWGRQKFGPSTVDEEMQIQRKRMFSEDEKPPYMYRRKRHTVKPVEQRPAQILTLDSPIVPTDITHTDIAVAE